MGRRGAGVDAGDHRAARALLKSYFAAGTDLRASAATLFKILGEHRVRLRVRFYAALSVEKPWFRGRAALSLAYTWHPAPHK